MAISSSLWLVLLSFAGVACGGGKVSFKLGKLENDSFSGPNQLLTITFEKDGVKRTKGITSTLWSYQCLPVETKLQISLVLRNADAKITTIHAAKYDNGFKELKISENPNEEFGSEDVKDEFTRICVYQGTWYPQGSDNPTIYVKLDHGIERTPDINTLVFRLEVEGKVLNMKIIKSVIASFMKEKILRLTKADSGENNKPMESIMFTKFGKGVNWVQLILRNLNCELEDPTKRLFEINKITIEQKGDGIFIMPIFTQDMTDDGVFDAAVAFANGGLTFPVASDLATVKCIKNGISYLPSEGTNAFYSKVTGYCRGEKLDNILLQPQSEKQSLLGIFAALLVK